MVTADPPSNKALATMEMPFVPVRITSAVIRSESFSGEGSAAWAAFVMSIAGLETVG